MARQSIDIWDFLKVTPRHRAAILLTVFDKKRHRSTWLYRQWPSVVITHGKGAAGGRAIAALGAGIRSGSRRDSRRLWRRQSGRDWLFAVAIFAGGVVRCRIEGTAGPHHRKSFRGYRGSPSGGWRGAARGFTPLPVMNAGDGEGGQHPTQAVLDLYTVEASASFSQRRK